MNAKTLNQIKYLLNEVVGVVEEIDDDSNRFYDNLQKLTDLIRNSGATKDQMNRLTDLGQDCIDDTDNADFMASYQDGEHFEKYVKSILKSLK